MHRLGGEEQDDPQARMAELAPILSALPKGTQVCVIQDGDDLRLYNINQAFELTKGREPTATIDVARRARLVWPRDDATAPDDSARIDPEHAESVDLAYPVLIVESAQEMDGSPGRVIDGWHRIYRASQLGIAELPAIVIGPDEEALIRIDPNPAPGRDE